MGLSSDLWRRLEFLRLYALARGAQQVRLGRQDTGLVAASKQRFLAVNTLGLKQLPRMITYFAGTFSIATCQGIYMGISQPHVDDVGSLVYDRWQEQAVLTLAAAFCILLDAGAVSLSNPITHSSKLLGNLRAGNAIPCRTLCREREGEREKVQNSTIQS